MTEAMQPSYGEFVQKRLRRPKYSARAFVLTFTTIIAIATLSLFADLGSSRSVHQQSPHKRDLFARMEDEECRLVHNAPDKCAFVRANCPDEEAGIFSYLTLYYCRLPNAQPIAFTILVLWLCLLFSTIGIAASDFFCVNLSTISSLLGMSESMAGVTFLAFGNGSPDVFSTFAAMKTNSGSLAVGELMGAAGFITAVVAGSMALVRPFKVARRSFVRDVGFFIVAASFSLIFLYDGKLYLWECASMVGFYVFYVIFVVVWHSYLNRRRKRKETEAAIRSQYVVQGGEEAEVEAYHDDEDGGVANTRPTPSRGISFEDFSALERADQAPELEDDENEDNLDRWLGELNSNMRLSRPTGRERRNTHNPIRPSLVGALEFRAVLSSLKKSRNIQTIPLNLRRYSDDPTFTTAQQQDQLSTVSDQAARPPYYVPEEADERSPLVVRPGPDVRNVGGNRLRAVSANDVEALRVDPNALQRAREAVPAIDLLGPLSEDEDQPTDGTIKQQAETGPPSLPPHSPSISLSPPPSHHGSRAPSPRPSMVRRPSPDRLAPPDNNLPGAQRNRQPADILSPASGISPMGSPGPQPQNLPKLAIPGQVSHRRDPSSPMAPFPAFSDYPTSARSSRPPSLLLPPASASVETDPYRGPLEDEEEEKPLRWWPYKVLPPPRVLLATLFPTIYTWPDKNMWERFLGVIAAPSVLLLTITLPVVETESDDEDEPPPELSLPVSVSISSADHRRKGSRRETVALAPDSPDIQAANGVPVNGHHANGHGGSHGHSHGIGGHSSTATVAASTEEHYLHLHHAQPSIASPTHPHILQSPEQLSINSNASSEPRSWNRWLVILQTFTAPFFLVLIVWANTAVDSPSRLLRYTLFSLLFSLCILALILLTTTPERPPRWRIGLCFLGFAVAIAWISSIANEVVGVLKTLGVILDISDAILGLTIFAVGNSLGDLVADITVARLGYPVMALSACFGGPMLNILLGIGLSGCYITITGAQEKHEHHPDRPMKYKPYHMDINTTLMISGATLLITLVGLLIVVPLRKWRMDRMIGWGLVGLWCTSTICNVLAEVLGWGGKVS